MLPICLTLNKYNSNTFGYIEYEDDLPVFINICVDRIWLMYGTSFFNFAKSVAEVSSHEVLHNLFFDNQIPEQYHHIIIQKLHRDLFNLEMKDNYFVESHKREENIKDIISIAYV